MKMKTYVVFSLISVCFTDMLQGDSANLAVNLTSQDYNIQTLTDGDRNTCIDISRGRASRWKGPTLTANTFLFIAKSKGSGRSPFTTIYTTKKKITDCLKRQRDGEHIVIQGTCDKDISFTFIDLLGTGTLCEMFISRECKKSDTRQECQQTCNCKQKKECNVSGAKCPSGCKHGFHGHDCQIAAGNNTLTSLPVKCHCQKKSECAAEKRTCPSGCKLGYEGVACKTPCALRYKYGKNCTKSCGHCLQNKCNPKGKCDKGCLSGWKGQRCWKKCQPGSFGDRCNMTCGANCKRTCNHVNGSCTHGCKDGWTGQMCEKENVYLTETLKGCASGWYGEGCKHKCSDNCADKENCDVVKGSCDECIPGWTGDRCDQACTKGTFGANCSSRCSPNCKSQSCNVINGYCECEPGWQGPTCEKACTKGIFGVNCRGRCSLNCKSQSCNVINGHCECEPGWQGPTCEKACTKGTFGANCSSRCSPNCKPQSCNVINGHCECEPGWQGPTCEKECLPQMYGQGCRQHCSQNCEKRECHHVSGTCLSCNPGWKPPECNEKCDQTWFGQNCSEQCDWRCKDRQCSAKSGDCFNGCEPGWGPHTRCKQKCLPQMYGQGCRQYCNQNCEKRECHHVSGTCLSCNPGWKPPECNERCDQTWFGQNCSKQCDWRCKDGVCYAKSGYCFYGCEPGWRPPDRCDQKCARGYFGTDCRRRCQQRCSDRSCDGVSGRCENECPAGFTGNNCSRECPVGRFGQGCKRPCSFNCLNRTCDHITGGCVNGCKVGYMGQNCSLQCTEGFYGRNCKETCSPNCQTQICDILNGSCSCKPGWTGSTCREVCPQGKFGSGCNQTCNIINCFEKLCNHVTGNCSHGCKPGKIGDFCHEDCATGFYGRDCQEFCENCESHYCNAATGECQNKCNSGWVGLTCTEQATATNSSQLGLIAGIVLLVAIAVIVVVAVGLFIHKRRVLKGSNQNKLRTGADHCRVVEKDEEEESHFGADQSLTSGNANDVNENTNSLHQGIEEPVYANAEISDTCAVSTVTISDLRTYVEEKKEMKQEFQKEFSELPKGLTASHLAASKPANAGKNRFRDIYPYEFCRVKLKRSHKSKEDYINGSYINGFNRTKQYIATQGPMPHTIDDFWEMIWLNNCPGIVMLANVVEEGKQRCEQYWPNEGTKVCGHFKITVLEQCQYADFIVRTIQIQKGLGATKIIKHAHYTVWPDMGVPQDTLSLVTFRNKVRALCSMDKGLLVVHCSAGVGRTGTFIALDMLLEQAQAEKHVDIFATVWKLRTQRVKMVQTLVQYEFLHDILLEALVFTVPPLQSYQFTYAFKTLYDSDNKTGKSQLAATFEMLQQCRLREKTVDAATFPENVKKNRSSSIVPADSDRAFLRTPVDGTTDYINAVVLSTYVRKKAFIVTQTPLSETVIDFWRLVFDYSCETIVMLDAYNERNKDCGVYWATEDKNAEFGPFELKRVLTESDKEYSVETYQLKHTNKADDIVTEQTLKLFRCTFWASDAVTPGTATPLLNLIQLVRQWQQQTGDKPIIVHCRNGATRSGLFCVISAVLEWFESEQEIAIEQTIWSMRSRRKQFITDIKQLHFCHEAVNIFLENYGMYANVSRV